MRGNCILQGVSLVLWPLREQLGLNDDTRVGSDPTGLVSLQYLIPKFSALPLHTSYVKQRSRERIEKGLSPRTSALELAHGFLGLLSVRNEF